MNYYSLAALSLIIGITSGCSVTSGPPAMGMKYHHIYPGGMLHHGLDLDVPYNSPVRAISDGVVSSVKQTRDEIFLGINHGDGNFILYYHLGQVMVHDGEIIKKGQIIAYTGATGYSSPARTQKITYPHLHIEYFKNGTRVNPESLAMTCPDNNSQWWWPVGCNEFYKK